MRVLLLAAVLVACSSSETTKTVTKTDAAAVPDTSSSPDSGGEVDLPSCTPPPKDGAPCPVEGQHCDSPLDCGPTAGTFATCTMGKWKVVMNPCTTGDSGAPG